MKYAGYFCILVFIMLLVYWSSMVMMSIATMHVSVCELKDDVSEIQKDLNNHDRDGR